MPNISEYVEIIRARQAAQNKLEKTAQSVQPSGVPGGGDTDVVITQSVLPAGLDGELDHRIFQVFPITAAVGASQLFESTEQVQSWFVRLSSTAGQSADAFVGAQSGGTGLPIYTDGTAKIPARGSQLTILNTGAVALDGVVVALAGLNLDYTPGGGGGGGGAVTVADGADVAEGATADAAWGGVGAGTVVAILKAIYADLAAVSIGPGILKDVTLSLDTNIYAIADVLAATQEITNVALQNGGSVLLDMVQILDEDDQGQALDLLFFDANTSIGAENAAFSLTDADARTLLGWIQVAAGDFTDWGGQRTATLKRADAGFKADLLQCTGATRSIWVAAICRSGTPTYTASGIKLRLHTIPQ